MSDINCSPGGGADTYFGLRVGSIFIILAGSTFGALFPVLAKDSSWLKVPKAVYDFAKYFGSGVIIATAFIHLLSPGIDALTRPCLSDEWRAYPYPLALCLLSICVIFVLELVAFRWGSAKLAAIGKEYDTHGHQAGAAHAAHGPEGAAGPAVDKRMTESRSDVEIAITPSNLFDHNLLTQVIGVAILEFGVVLHSILIGLTLAVDENFKVLLIVIVFHQTFEGLGIGSRLAYLELPKHLSWLRIAGAILYAVTTPIGIAAGLGIRTTYNPNTATASIVSGVMDSLSAGILLYTGTVELLAHDFLFNREMLNASNGYLAYAVGCMFFGCGVMALLGNWA